MNFFSAQSKLAVVFAFAIVGFASRSATAAVELQIDVDTHNTPRQANAKIPADSKESLEVVLADGYISVKAPTETRIFDFKTRRRIVLDRTAKTYVDYSLYDIVGFRTLELRNREMLHGALAAAKIGSALMTTIDNEHTLAVQSSTPAKVGEAVDGDNVVFSDADHELARWSKKGTDVGAADVKQFAGFLRYNLGGHPQILKSLAAGTVIPDRLVFTFVDGWGTGVHSLLVKSVRQIDSPSYDISSYAKRNAVQAHDPIDSIVDRADAAPSTAIESAKTDSRVGQESDFHDGHLLDALLGLSEWSLMTGQQPSRLSPEQLATVRADPSVQKFTSVIGVTAKNKDAMADAIKALVELRAQAPKKAYVLKLFEANDRLQLGDPATAKVLFTEVLQGNLFLAGAYKDLGDLLFLQYDTPRAWRCWDIGRRIAPQFANFAAISRFEQSLLTQYPEYF
jgi:hypothetical protein